MRMSYSVGTWKRVTRSSPQKDYVVVVQDYGQNDDHYYFEQYLNNDYSFILGLTLFIACSLLSLSFFATFLLMYLASK